jgi:hypothetical protein
MMIAIMGGAVWVSTAMVAGAEAAVPRQAALTAAQNPAFSSSPMNAMVAPSSAPAFTPMIQRTMTDFSAVSLLFAWAAVAMFLALCWFEWKRT